MTMATPPENRRPWDDEEMTARRLAGAPEIAPVIRTCATEPMRAFFAGLDVAFVGGLDRSGQPAATILQGAPGFLTLPEPGEALLRARTPRDDEIMLAPGAAIALIGVDFLALRRNRLNGRVRTREGADLRLKIDEAFGNCPKYMTRRALRPGPGGEWTERGDLDVAVRETIARADLFFLVTRGAHGVDISHRGGPAGFVEILPDGELRIEDFRGNNYFNSLGNLLFDKRAALLVPDFRHGVAVNLAGVATVDFLASARCWRFRPQQARMLSGGPICAAPASVAE